MRKSILFLWILLLLGTGGCWGQDDYLNENSPYYKALQAHVNRCFVKPAGEILTEAPVRIASELPVTIDEVTFIDMQRPDLKKKVNKLKQEGHKDYAQAISLSPVKTFGDTLSVHVDQITLSFRGKRLFTGTGSALIVDFLYDREKKTYVIIDIRWQGI